MHLQFFFLSTQSQKSLPNSSGLPGYSCNTRLVGCARGDGKLSRTYVQVCNLVVLDVLDQAVGAADSISVGPVVSVTVWFAGVVACSARLATVGVAGDVVDDVFPPFGNVIIRERPPVCAVRTAIHHAVVVNGDLLVSAVAEKTVILGVA